MRIMGIDPGLATIGIGVIDSKSPHDLLVHTWWTLTTDAGTPLADRLQEIQQDLSALLTEVKPDLVVVERLFFATNEKTAFDVAHARGVILLEIGKKHVPYIEPTPLQLKCAITGDGKAGKRQMQEMVMRMLELSAIPESDDAADALALAVYGALQQQTLSLDKLRIEN